MKVAPPNKGFTLLEMAIVLVVVALILGTLIIPMSAQVSIRDNHQAQADLGLIKESIIGFAVSNNRLPCPDINFDGNEDLASTDLVNFPAGGQVTENFACASEEGVVPYSTLGLNPTDTWFNYIGYRVSANFKSWTKVWGGLDKKTLIGSSYFTLSSVGNITVNGRGDNPNTTGVMETKFITPITTNAIAVVISYGRNGYGAFNKTDTSLNDAPPSKNVDETTNATKGVVKVSRVHTDKLGDCSDTDESKSFCEFDDVVDWISPNILFNRMVQAGKLP